MSTKKLSVIRTVIVGTSSVGKKRFDVMRANKSLACVAFVDASSDKVESLDLIDINLNYLKDRPPPTFQFLAQIPFDFEAVWITTEPNKHLYNIKEALDSGVKTIFCEAPIAPSQEEIKEAFSVFIGFLQLIYYIFLSNI